MAILFPCLLRSQTRWSLCAGTLLLVCALLSGGFAGARAQDVLLLSTSLLQDDPDLTAEVAEYAIALSSHTGQVASHIVVDSSACEELYGTRVINPLNWAEIRAVLGQIRTLTGAGTFLILGGMNAFPRPVVNLPSKTSWVSVPGDAWYVDFDGDEIVDADCSVARIADLGRACEIPCQALRTATTLHQAGGLSLTSEVRFTTDDYTTPPYGVCTSCTMRSEFFSLMSSHDTILFAGHGTPTGFFTDGGLPIFTVSHIDSVDLMLRHPVIYGYFSCNTGNPHATVPTLSTEFTRAGASVFLARTTTEGVPVHVAENLPVALAAGEPVGAALFRLMRETVLIYGDGFKAAAAHLVLYGDPTLARRDPTAVPIVDDADGSGPLSLRITPNPFNARTTFHFFRPAAGQVSLAIYDLQGRLVRTLHEDIAAAGPQSVTWDGVSDRGHLMGSGVYIVKLKAEEDAVARKFSLMK